MHDKKLKIRGYNQSESIAKGISKVIQIPVETGILYKHRHQNTQTKRSKIERIKVMAKTFNVHAHPLVDKKVLLVDDVLTTGATLVSCVEQLQKLNPSVISIAVLAGVK